MRRIASRCAWLPAWLLIAACSQSHGPPAGDANAAAAARGGGQAGDAASAGPRPAGSTSADRDAGRPRRPAPGAPTGLPQVERTELGAPKRMLASTGYWALKGVEDEPVVGLGMACDGELVWVLTKTLQLLRYDLARGEITRELRPSVASEGGINPGGIERVGDEIWIAVAGNQNGIVMVDVETGEVVRTTSSPSELGPTDLAVGEEGVWLSDGTGGIFLLDRETADVLWEANLAFPERDYGIALHGDEVVIGFLFGGLFLHRRDDLSVIAELVDEDGKRIPQERMGTMCFAGDRLRILNGYGIEELSFLR